MYTSQTGARPLTKLVGAVLRVFPARAVFGAVLALLTASLSAGQPVVFVDADAAGASDGSSWEDAYTDLQNALATAADSGGTITEIWVAAGVYIPSDLTDPEDPRSATFQLLNSLALYGGFAGWETSLDQRDPATNITILTGDLNGDDGPDFENNGENTYHVVTGSDTDATAVIDGFTITAGNADGPLYSPNDSGGGMNNWDGSPTVTRCVIAGNSARAGGGIVNGRGNPALTNCAFYGNRAEYGAGLYTYGSFAPLTNCVFIGNTSMFFGGAIYTIRSEPTLTNCTFSANFAGLQGGGMYTSSWYFSTLTNCIFWGNRDSGGTSESAQIFGGTPLVNYSCIQGLTGALGGTGNIAGNPMFVRHPTDGGDGWVVGENDDYGNLRLMCGSPGIDAGDNTALPSDVPDLDGDGDVFEHIPFDFEGGPRIIDGIVDLGAYEGSTQGFVIAGDPLGVPEGGEAAFTVALACEPLETVNVTVSREGGDEDITIQSGESLVFHTSDYSVPQEVTLFAAEDEDSVSGTVTIEVSAPAISFMHVSAFEAENEVPSVLFVDVDATGPVHDGTSWCNAHVNLQDAMAAASASGRVVTEIRVAEGTYKPDEGADQTPGDREATFHLLNDVTLRGGYAGCGADDPDEWNISAHETILSGDLDGDDEGGFEDPSHAENAYHVLTGTGTDATAILDGFTVTGGNANADSYFLHYSGGGMYTYAGSFTMTNCTFTANSSSHGGAMANDSASPTLTRCAFTGNWAGSSGGVYNIRSSPTFTNCTFSDNSATRHGGGMRNSESHPLLLNCAFVNNSAQKGGGGMYNQVSSSPTLVNCTFSGNSAPNAFWDEGGGGIYNSSRTGPELINCVFSGNSTNKDGGGMYDRGSPTLINCLFTGNSADENGGGMYIDGLSARTLANCIFWANRDAGGSNEPAQIAVDSHAHGDTIINYSCVQGWTGELGGAGNIGDDPIFVEPGYWDDGGTPGDPEDDVWVDGNYRLQAGSPSINAGDPDFVPEPNQTDLDGHARVLCDRVDMGPYEFGIGDFDCDQVVDLTDFSYWIDCITGPHSGPYGEGCEAFDFDADDDVDLTDFAGLQIALTEP